MEGQVTRTWAIIGGDVGTVSYTILALLAFAANSVLCRFALHSGAIDPASFLTIRFVSGAAMLLIVTTLAVPAAARPAASRTADTMPARRAWTSAGVMILYAVPFSFAYSRLTTGTGALILFGCVQATMLSVGLWLGERPHPLAWAGLGLASAGLIYLVSPGLTAPPLAAAGLMALAGFAWGIYSLRGRGSASPLTETSGNLVRSLPLVLIVSLAARSQFHIERVGALSAAASGALATGLGWVVWYRALRGLTATHAAVVQLAVPILAAAAGVVFLSETISQRFVISAAMTLGGIALALRGQERSSHSADVSTV